MSISVIAMTRRIYFSFMLLVSLSFYLVSGIKDCPATCIRRLCRTGNEVCVHGQVVDECGCCPVCLRKDGEKCGGLYGKRGRCMPGFICYQIKSAHSSTCIPAPSSCSVTPKGTVAIGTEWIERCVHYTCTETGEVSAEIVPCLYYDCGGNEETHPCCEVCNFSVKVQCTTRSMSINIPKLLINHPVQGLTLIDNNCTGSDNGTHLQFQTGINRCGTLKSTGHRFVYFKNAVRSLLDGKIHFEFDCLVRRRRQLIQKFLVIDEGIISSHAWFMFTSPEGRRYPKVAISNVPTGHKKLFMEIRTPKILRRHNLVMNPTNCGLSSNKVYVPTKANLNLINDGCPGRPDIDIHISLGHSFWFSFDVNHDEYAKKMYYINCDVVLCSRFSRSSKCMRKC